MSKPIQQLISDVTEAELSRWRKVGVKIDGTRVLEAPAEYELALRRFQELEGMLLPEFKVESKGIEPESLYLSAKASKAPGIELWFRLKPYRKKDESGYEGVAVFYLGVKDYPSYVPEVLHLTAHSGCEDLKNETMSGDYKFTQRTDYRYWDVLKNTVNKMKLNLKVALSLREYEMRHS